MSSSDQLKRAAAKLRETAAATTPSPWETRVRHGGSLTTIISNDPGSKTLRHGPRVVANAATATRDSAANLAYCVLMQPSVAEPLALWLEATATAMGLWAPYREHETGYDMWTSALAVARIILGEAS